MKDGVTPTLIKHIQARAFFAHVCWSYMLVTFFLYDEELRKSEDGNQKWAEAAFLCNL